MDKVSWRSLIEKEMERHGETWDDAEQASCPLEAFWEEFDNSFGFTNGFEFTLWTRNRIYFPAVYDGAEWAASVPRNPCNEKTRHVGGGNSND